MQPRPSLKKKAQVMEMNSCFQIPISEILLGGVFGLNCAPRIKRCKMIVSENLDPSVMKKLWVFL